MKFVSLTFQALGMPESFSVQCGEILWRVSTRSLMQENGAGRVVTPGTCWQCFVWPLLAWYNSVSHSEYQIEKNPTHITWQLLLSCNNFRIFFYAFCSAESTKKLYCPHSLKLLFYKAMKEFYRCSYTHELYPQVAPTSIYVFFLMLGFF